MSKLKDLTNQKFGKLTVLERVNDKIHPSGQHSVMWKCQCECGNIITTSSANLRNNHTMSCGCYREKRLYESRKKYNKYDLSNDYGIGIDSKGNYFYFRIQQIRVEVMIMKNISNLSYKTNRLVKFLIKALVQIAFFIMIIGFFDYIFVGFFFMLSLSSSLLPKIPLKFFSNSTSLLINEK